MDVGMLIRVRDTAGLVDEKFAWNRYTGLIQLS